MQVRFERILFPTDFSDLAQCGWAYAASVAEKFSAELHCLHVVDDAYQYWSTLGPESIPIGPPPEDLLQLGRSRMERLRTELFQGLARPVIAQVTMGRPFAEIIAYAKEHRIDLIVMGTHGRGAIAHALLGSTTEKVVRKAPCPVMTIRPEGHRFEMP